MPNPWQTELSHIIVDHRTQLFLPQLINGCGTHYFGNRMTNVHHVFLLVKRYYSCFSDLLSIINIKLFNIIHVMRYTCVLYNMRLKHVPQLKKVLFTNVQTYFIPVLTLYRFFIDCKRVTL